MPSRTHQDSDTLHRSGAVARMLRMPVATLRVWERRYALTQTALSASGQRLYAADDVRRLALMRQLVDCGHAIGSLATLTMAQLQQVAATHAQALATAQAAEPEVADPPWRVAVIGRAIGSRLQRPAWPKRPLRPLAVLGPFADITEAASALRAGDVDVLLLHEAQLQADWLATLNAAAPDLAPVPKAVLYGFAAEPVCEALAEAGVALLRDPQPDAVLAQWLHLLGRTPAPRAAPPAPPQRRWDDAALSDFAGLSSTIACECPRHVAELLMQLSHFEAYSAECQNRSPADAELHAYLRDVAAASRTRFEQALEQVALHEGLILPPARS